MAAAPSYQPELIEEHAAELYGLAQNAGSRWTGAGALAGILAGAAIAFAVPALVPLPARVGLVAACALVLVLALAGRAHGARRAKAHRLRAQLVLCAVHG